MNEEESEEEEDSCSALRGAALRSAMLRKIEYRRTQPFRGESSVKRVKRLVLGGVGIGREREEREGSLVGGVESER